MPSTLLRAISCSVRLWVGGSWDSGVEKSGSWVAGFGFGVEERIGEGAGVGEIWAGVGDAVKRSKELVGSFDGLTE